MIFLRDAATAPQQGHRMIVLLRARLSRTNYGDSALNYRIVTLGD